MIGTLKRKIFDNHRPSAERLIGVSSVLYFSIALFGGVAWLFAFGVFNQINSGANVLKSLVEVVAHDDSGYITLEELAKLEFPDNPNMWSEQIKLYKSWPLNNCNVAEYQAAKTIHSDLMKITPNGHPDDLKAHFSKENKARDKYTNMCADNLIRSLEKRGLKGIKKPVPENLISVVSTSENANDFSRGFALFGAISALYILIMTGGKYSIIRNFRFIRNEIFLGLFVVGGIAYFILARKSGADIPAELQRAALVAIPPMLFFYVPIGWLVAKEWAKETNFYRKHVIVGQKAASGRWGGVKSFFMRDCTSYINKVTPQGAPKTRESWLYLGKTPWRFDYQLGKRHIGTNSDNHHILCSSTGGGKSLAALNNIVTAWNGGGLIFDPKGELYTCSIRFKSCPTYLFDPWQVVKVNGAQRHGWNPLSEIDPNSDKARGQLQRLCEAIVFEKSSNGGGSSEFFKENGQMILRGFCAHILTAFPSELQNLPAVYDIFKAGYPQGTEKPREQVLDPKTRAPMFQPDGVTPIMRELNPEECREKLLQEMLQNEAIGAAPRDAAQLLLGKDPKLKENFFSTVARAIDWCNDTTLRPWLCKNDFSMREIKTKEAFVTLCISEDVIEQQTRFLKVIYQLAGDLLDKSNTPNPTGHNRKSLFLFEEFKLFGRFKAAESIATYKRGSNIKALFVVQSLSQFEANYGESAQDFLDNCDIQIFGVSGMSTKVLQMISDALGKKEGVVSKDARGVVTDIKPLLDPDGVRQLIDAAGDEMLFIPVKGFFPMILQRVKCYKLFKWTNV